MRTFHALATALALSSIAGCDAAPAAGPVSPATLARRLLTSSGGETLRLLPGDYGVLVFPKKRYSRPLVIDAQGARFAKVVIENGGNVSIRGGTISGGGGIPPYPNYGAFIRKSDAVSFENMQFTDLPWGLSVLESRDVRLIGNRFERMRVDGMNIALSRSVRIERNICRNFNPVPPVWRDGVLVKDGDHPDCIQVWSRPTSAPTADITIIDNDMEGKMQGIGFFNHGDDGGYDRIVIANNRIKVAFGQAIGLYDARDSIVTGNSVETLPGAVLPNNGRPIHAAINVIGTTRTTACGNRIVDLPKLAPAQSCSRGERTAIDRTLTSLRVASRSRSD